jgi:branched-chain amino acid transport system substrate-binding protein
MKRSILFLCIFALATLVFAQKKPMKNDSVIRIGVIAPLTGSLSESGKDFVDGITFAQDLINKKNNYSLPLAQDEGLPNFDNKKIEFIVKDNESKPEMSGELCARLIEEERVCGIIGAYSSDATAMILETAVPYGVPVIVATATSEFLNSLAPELFIRTTPNDQQISEDISMFFEYLKANKYIIESISILSIDNMWGQHSGNMISDKTRSLKYKAHGISMYPVEEYKNEITHFFKNMRDLPEHAIIQNAYTSDAIETIKIMKSMDYKPKVFFGNDAGFIDHKFLKEVGNDIEGLFSREVFATDLIENNSVAKELNTSYKKKYGSDFNGTSSRSFTAAYFLLHVINDIRSIEHNQILGALREIKLENDITIVPWGIDINRESGENTAGKSIVVQYIDGEYRTVWPKNVNTVMPEDIIMPFKGW